MILVKMCLRRSNSGNKINKYAKEIFMFVQTKVFPKAVGGEIKCQVVM